MRYKDYKLPKWTVNFVHAAVEGQEVRRKLIDAGAAAIIAARYEQINEAVNSGLRAACEPGEIEHIYEAILYRKGYRTSTGYPGGEKRFYNIKRRAIYEIAARLDIAPMKFKNKRKMQ